MTEEEIVKYLRGNPGFFDRHAEALAQIVLVSPHSRRAVSLQERQAELLREKIRGLESRLMEMIRHGNDNLVLADRLLRWARDLLLEEGAERLPDAIVQGIQQKFSVPQVAMRLWGVIEPHAQEVSEDVRLFAESLQEPYCGLNSDFEAATWLEEPEEAISLAMLPLREDGQTFGLLVLASPDSERYASNMGTDFLVRIANIASAALARLRQAQD